MMNETSIIRLRERIYAVIGLFLSAMQRFSNRQRE
jgi:hypothetical protein